MSKVKIIGEELKNIPWQEKPKDCKVPVWRYSENPVIKRNPVEGVSRIFNSALVPYKGEYIGVFRAETLNGIPYIYLGYSKDGIDFRFEDKPIEMVDESGKKVKFEYSYDPRLVRVEDKYYAIWCNDFHGPTLSIAETTDFKKFVMKENPLLPFNRNGVLFPRKIDGEYILLSRPSDSGHTPFGDIFMSKSKDLTYWGKHKYLMGKSYEWWQTTKIGGGCAPIETSEGWLLFYHGVTNTCNGYVYSMGGAILDIDNPEIVKYRCENFLLTPEADYEVSGFVPNVTFPCAALTDAKTGKIAIYYGAADTVVGLCFTEVNEVVEYIKKYAQPKN